jgi:hypothetical protein
MRDQGSATHGSVALPRPGALDALLERLAAAMGRLRALGPGELSATWGRFGLGALVAGAIAVVAFSTAGGSLLVPRSRAAFPAWEAGPLQWLFGHPHLGATALTLGYSGLLLVMCMAYAVALLAARSLSLRTVAAFAVAVNLVLLLGPPLQLTDLFNYLGYARLGALHGLNPYTHVVNAEVFDPIYRFTSWHNLPSPYGPLFTALTYPLAWLPLPIAYWVVKVATVAASLGFVWCVHRCAVLLGRDPRPAVLLVAANPIYIFFAIGAFHNDFLMLLPSMAAVLLLLSRRDRSAGAVLMLAVAIKFTAVLLLPFLLMGARPPERRLRVITGAVLAALPLLALSLGLFGFTTPNLADQSSVVTGYSIPNLIGLMIGLGGRTPGLMRVLDVLLVLIVLWQLRRRDWLAAAGWSTIALIACTSWLMPWYILWALPLAAVAGNPRLRRATLVFSVFLVLTFLPEWGPLLSQNGINPMSTPVGQAASAYQNKLQR